MVQAREREETGSAQPQSGLLELVYFSHESADESDAVVKQLRVANKGSQPHCARKLIQGATAYGIIDSGHTVMDGALFKQVATTAR